MKYVTDLRPCSCSHCEILFTITVHKVINPRNGLDSVAHSSECLFLHKDQRLWTFVYAAFFHVIWFRCSVLSNKEIQCWAWSFLGFVRFCLFFFVFWNVSSKIHFQLWFKKALLYIRIFYILNKRIKTK